MPLSCGIVGLANTGKTTLFNCISNTRAQASAFAFSQSKSNIGQINVPDERLYKLDELIHSAKIVHTTVEIVDIPGLAKGSSKGEGVGNAFLNDIRNVDALIHVLRCFDNDQLQHIEGSVDPIRDREILDLELQVKDLESVDKKIHKYEKLLKIGDKDAKHGLEILTKYKDHLENFQSARTCPVDAKDKIYIQDMCLLTDKPVMYVCNVDDKSAVTGNKYTQAVIDSLKNEKADILIIAGALESEINELESKDDRLAFLQDVGLSEPGVNKLVRSAYSLLNMQTFFTAGPKEIKAWTIKKGMTAPQAAGVIHSDIERGFIRAEIMKYNDFITLKTEHACREAGKLYVEGKNYVMEDGDIIHVRFNV